jgi:predicted transcriptional regulator
VKRLDRRNRLGITSEILEASSRGIRRSHIAFEAKLNYKLLTSYLDKLEKYNLIETKIQPGNKIRTTEKGHRFVRLYHELLDLAGNEDVEG